jgi:hypothetical protein
LTDKFPDSGGQTTLDARGVHIVYTGSNQDLEGERAQEAADEAPRERAYNIAKTPTAARAPIRLIPGSFRALGRRGSTSRWPT